MNLVGVQRGMFKQAFAQVGEISVRVFSGYALVDLHHMHSFPGELFAGQGAQHLPGGMAAADGHDETAARRDRRPSLRGDDRGSRSGDRIGIGKHLNLHAASPNRLRNYLKTAQTSLIVIPTP